MLRWNRRIRKTLWDPVMILAGAAVFAFSLHFFVIPSQLMEGGLAGIALLLKYTLDVSPWMTTLLINLALLAASWKVLGRRSVLYTIMGAGAFSLSLWIFEVLPMFKNLMVYDPSEDILLTALYAGLSTGLGIGMVLRYGGSTGGSALIARMLQHTAGWKQGTVILVLDIVVIGISLLYLSIEKVLYSLVMVFVTSRAIDFVTQGAHSAKAVTVFTQMSSQLAACITKELGRGLTLYSAKGGFTLREMDVVYCIVSRSEVHRLKQLVNSLDPEALLIVHDVQEVHGEGFTRELSEIIQPTQKQNHGIN